MKIVNRDIDIVSFQKSTDDHPQPLKMRLLGEREGFRIIKIDRILNTFQEKRLGHSIWIFDCETVDKLSGQGTYFQIHFNKDRCKWILYKI